ncbi:MAG: hypothetical protein ACPG4M_09680, partial [Alphaproteobacteria bacterium]
MIEHALLAERQQDKGRKKRGKQGEQKVRLAAFELEEVLDLEFSVGGNVRSKSASPVAGGKPSGQSGRFHPALSGVRGERRAHYSKAFVRIRGAGAGQGQAGRTLQRLAISFSRIARSALKSTLSSIKQSCPFRTAQPP